MNNTPDYNDNLYFEKLQKTENVANNVTNENSQDLTEKWKKGELPSGWYYIKCGDGGIYPSENCLNYDCLNDRAYSDFYYAEDEIEEIVDKVPSYEKWLKFQNVTADKMLQNSELEIENIKLKRENAQLKDLLKECKEYIENIPVEDKSQAHNNAINLLWSIDEVVK